MKNNENVKRNFEMVDVNLLNSGLAYQRPIKEDFVRDIVENFDPYEVEPPCVSLRDGKYNVVDGQHTISIVKKVGWRKIRCEVRRGLTEEMENEWFVSKNTKHRTQTKGAILNGRYFSGIDERLNDLVAYLAVVGYKLKTSDIKNSDGVINASDTIEKIFIDMGKQEFIKYITLHQSVWNGDKKSLQASFLKGFAKFYNTYKKELEDDRFIKVFNSHMNKKCKTVDEITYEADKDVFTKDVSVRYSRVLVKYYNLKLSKQKQLKMSRLDD